MDGGGGGSCLVSRAVLLHAGIVVGLALALLALLWFFAHEFTQRRWKARIDDVRRAIDGLYGVHGDALEPLWESTRAAVAMAIGEILCEAPEHISVRPRQHPGGPQICGVLVILRGAAATENPRMIARLELEIRAALPAWAYFKFAIDTAGLPHPLDRLSGSAR